MKTIGLEKSDLNSCIHEVQQDRIVIIQRGKPVALMIGIDQEQLALGGKWLQLKCGGRLLDYITS